MARKQTESCPRERISFNHNWRFCREDVSSPHQQLAYAQLLHWIAATGTELINEGVSKPVSPHEPPAIDDDILSTQFDDSNWRQLDLPHDWAIEGPFSQDLPGETGKLPWQGVGWYRKHFTVDVADSGKCIFLDIDGAMSHSAIWLNGKLLGGWPYGYSSYRIELTPHLVFGGDNVLAVRLENPPHSSRWYPGSGLYRNLWLVKTHPVRIRHWGTFVSTPRVTSREAIVNVDVTLENTSDTECELVLNTTVYALGDAGKASEKHFACAEPFSLKLDTHFQTVRTQVITIKKPRLWSLKHRHRYLAVTTLECGGKQIERVETPFGIRTIRFDPDHGFFLNDEPTSLQGVCLHHDLGALGAAVNTRALERQIEIMQSMGCNSIRTSHNPPAPELLDLCDRMGMLVIDEAFDCWRRGKKWPSDVPENDPNIHYFDYAGNFDDWHERDLRALVRRDRNHPCVVMWSIGNEVVEQWYPDGWKLSSRLAGIAREEDRTRPVTAAFNAEIAGYSGFQTALDVLGYNYKPREYAKLRQSNPTLCIVGSETASTISTRGEYFFPVTNDKLHGQANFQVSSYDLSAPWWSNIPDDEFRGLDECPGVAGEYVWTGFDYLGEPTPYNADSSNLLNFTDPVERRVAEQELQRIGQIRVPSRSSYFGIVDLAGFPKDRFYLYQARWRPNLRMAHILPHWNWPERIDEVTPVHVYSAADEAELFLNGKSLGHRKRKRYQYRFRWDEVVYQPGELKVITYKNGKKWATAVRKTTGPAQKITLVPDRKSIRADGYDLAFVTVMISDEHGEVVPRSHNLLQFAISGPGVIVALDNGDPTSLESFQGNERHAFNGLALVVVRSVSGQAGKISLTVQSEGLCGTSATLQSKLLT
jgi:beta-galactosidase